MVAVRRYINPSEAALAKSLLDDYGIFCVLLDEYANVIRAPFAIPIRLMVDERQADAAARILAGDLSHIEQIEEIERDTPEEAAWSGAADENPRNPWELLAMASMFLVPSICFLLVRYPTIPAGSTYMRYVGAKVTVAHLIAIVFILIAVLLVVAYFALRRRSRRALTETGEKSGS